MLKDIGTDYFKGREYKYFLLFGNAIKDGAVNLTSTGKKIGKVSVKAGENKDGTADFISVTAWEEKADQYAAIRKGDTVLAIGQLREREYNGRIFRDLNAEFIAVNAKLSKLGIEPAAAPAEPAFEPVQQNFVDISADDDGELPF